MNRYQRMRERRGECVDCGKVPRDCECSSKTAALATGLDSAANGNDVQTKLLRNPFDGTPQAADFENGYQAAQGLGHLEINKAAPDQIQSLARQAPAWRTGFAQAALSMGCGTIARQINPDTKVATMILSLPLHMNVKIANALGTLAGTLAGAGIGAGFGSMQENGTPTGPVDHEPAGPHHVIRPQDNVQLGNSFDIQKSLMTPQELSVQGGSDLLQVPTDVAHAPSAVDSMRSQLGNTEFRAPAPAPSHFDALHSLLGNHPTATGAAAGGVAGGALGNALTKERKFAALEYFRNV